MSIRRSHIVRSSLFPRRALPALRWLAAAVLTTGLTGVRAQSVQAPAIDTASAPLFSSSSDQTATQTASLSPVPVNFAEYMQYGGGQRRSYGRPRYRGSNTTADGTPKYTFEAGAGFTQPIGNTWHYFTPSYGIQIGGGRNFNRHLGLLLQFDYDHFGLTGATLSNEAYLYTGDSHPSDNGIDANMHIWSFTLNPVFNLYQGKSWGTYGVVGAGFYHKVSNFVSPQAACLDYYCLYQGYVESNFDHYTSNAPGFNGGFGVTYKFSRFSNERFFGEVRYVFIDNSQRQGYTVQNSSYSSTGVFTSSYNGNDAFPANSNKTTYFPVKFGIRF